MDRARHAFPAQHRDRPFDLSPVAEVNHVSERPALVRAARRLVLGMLAIARHQLGRLGKRRAAVNMDMMFQESRPAVIISGPR